MTRCTACQQELPDDASFCGFCGFRLAPISKSTHRSLSKTLSPLKEVAPLLLTRPKQGKTKHPPKHGAATAAALKEGPRLDVTQAPEPWPQQPAKEGLASPQRAKLKLVRDPLQDENNQAAVPFQAPGPRRQKAPVRPDPNFRGPRNQAQFTEEATEGARERSRNRSESDRRFKRYPLKIEVTYSSEHNFYTGFMVNMSSGGLFVATHDPSPIGELIELTFSVPGLESYTANCRVRWVRDYEPDSPDMVPGMGLQFSQLDPEARAAIEMFIRHRDTIFFDDE